MIKWNTLVAAILIADVSCYVSRAGQSLPMTCGSIPVEIKNTNENAYFDAGPNVIRLSPSFLARFSPRAQQFIVTHECAHANSIFGEDEADDYAMTQGEKQGWLNKETVNELCLAFLSWGDYKRCLRLRNNYKDKGQ